LQKHWIIFNIWHRSSLKAKVVHWIPATKTEGQELTFCLNCTIYNRVCFFLYFKWQWQ
jgi:hypothetical protein